LNSHSATAVEGLLVAGKNRPADEFDGQVNGTEQSFERQ
jgi:hypothetical protein